MLEAYGTYLDYNDMADLTQRMYQKAVRRGAGHLRGRATTASRSTWAAPSGRRITLYGAVSEALGEEVTHRDAAGAGPRSSPTSTRSTATPSGGQGKLVQELFEELVEHTLHPADVRHGLPAGDLAR